MGFFLNIEKRVQGLELLEDINPVSPYATRVHLQCADQGATIFYTLDGTLPTRRYPNVYVKYPFVENRLIAIY